MNDLLEPPVELEVIAEPEPRAAIPVPKPVQKPRRAGRIVARILVYALILGVIGIIALATLAPAIGRC